MICYFTIVCCDETPYLQMICSQSFLSWEELSLTRMLMAMTISHTPPALEMSPSHATSCICFFASGQNQTLSNASWKVLKMIKGKGQLFCGGDFIFFRKRTCPLLRVVYWYCNNSLLMPGKHFLRPSKSQCYRGHIKTRIATWHHKPSIGACKKKSSFSNPKKGAEMFSFQTFHLLIKFIF